MSFEDDLKRIADRQAILKFITEMPEDSKGFIVVTSPKGDPDWRWFGKIRAWEGAGLLEFLRVDIFAEREDEDE